MSLQQHAFKQISAVLPLKLSGRWEDLARANLLFSSLEQFVAPNTIHTMLVVCPANERGALRSALSPFASLPFNIVCESDIVPGLEKSNLAGWVRQQILKLAVASSFDTEFYLTLDADVLLCQPMSIETLVRSGRAILEPEARTAHENWWRVSAQLLGLDVNLHRPGMFVTPAVLSRTICGQLFADIEERYGRSWVSVLSESATSATWTKSATWTEYTLYFLCAENHALLDRFHIQPTDDHVHLVSKHNVWYRSEFSGWDPSEVFGTKGQGLFTVVQSKIGISPKLVRNKISPYVAIQPRGFQAESSRMFWRIRLLLQEFFRATGIAW